jgi:predicted transposase/invertase (TIGR01784 family)
MTKTILDPTIDYVFKLIFGDQRNIELLAGFLKAALDIPEEEYESLEIKDPFIKRELIDDKVAILDVKVHTTSKIVINVEIQVCSFPELRKRIVMYSVKMLNEQIKRGEDWSEAKRAVSIIIMNEVLVPEEEAYYNRYSLRNNKSGNEFCDLMELNILELPKLPEDSDNRTLWTWGKFLRSRSEKEFKMVAEKDPIVKKAVATLMELSEDEATRLRAEARERWLIDQRCRERYQYKKGRDEGIQIGTEQGIQIGTEQGIQIGTEKVFELLEQGYTVDEARKMIAGKRREK